MASRPPTAPAFRSSALSALGLLLSAIAALAGCGSDPPAGGAGAGGDGGAGGGPSGAPTGQEMFAAIEEDLVATCGGCHQENGAADAPFLAQPDRYTSITAWPGIVVSTLG